MRLGHAKRSRLSEMLRRGLVLVVAFMMIFSGLMTAEPLEVLADDREEVPKTEAAQASSQENDPAQEETAEKSEESEKASAEAETEKAEAELTDANTDAADEAEAKEEAAEEKKDEYPASDGEVTWENRKAKVTVSYDENVFPADTKLDVKVLSKKEAIKIVEKAKNDKETADAYAIDITFTGTVDGKKVKNLQPKNKAGVRVEVSFKDRKVEGESYTVYHEDSKTGKVEAVKDAKGMTFTAGSFSIYAVDGEDAQKRASVQYMDYLGRLCSTKIVTVGGQLTSPAATGSPYDEKVFDHWEIRTADQQEGKGKALTTENFLYKTLDEETLDSLCALGTEGDNNLYSMKAYPVYRAAQRVFVRQYPYGEGGNNEAAVIDTMATKDYGDDKGQTVRMEDVSYALPPEMNNGEYTLIGWEERDPNGEVAATYEKDQDINHITANKTLYPKIISTRPVILDGNGGPDVPDTFAVYDEASDSYTLDQSKLPTEDTLGAGYRQGYTLEGWYTDSACTTPATDGMEVSKDKNNPTTLYAKWVPQDVKYTVIHMIEGPEGGPGEGVYTQQAVESKTAPAGSQLDVATATSGYNITGYHLPESGELGNGYTDNQKIDTIINGDGSTMVVVYWNRDRYKPTYTKDSVEIDPEMDSKYNGYVKWGEDVSIWDPKSNLRNSVQHTDTQNLWWSWKGDKKYFYDSVDVFPNMFENGAENEETVPFKKSQNSYNTEVTIRNYVEVIPGEENDEGVVSATIDGKERFFKLDDTVLRRTSSNTSVDYSVGEISNSNENIAYTNNRDKDIVTITPTSTGYFKRVGFYKEDTSSNNAFIDKFYQRQSYTLAYANIDGVDDGSVDLSVLDPHKELWGAPLNDYDPKFAEGETRRQLGQKEYTFNGWYTSSSAANNPDNPASADQKLDFTSSKMPKGDLTVYASWAPVMTRYTLDANAPDGATATFEDGSGRKADNPIEIGDKVTTSDAYEEPTCVGDDGTEYTFLGWYKDPNFESKWYPDQDVVTDKNGQTLYARWAKGVAETYQVRYHDLSGEVIPDDAESSDGKARQDTNGYANGSTANMFGDPKFDDAPEGSAFVGWSTVKDDSSKVVDSIKIGEDKFTLADGSADPNNPDTEKKQYHLYPIYRTEEQLKEEDKARAPKVTFHSGSESYPGKKFATPDTDVTFEKQPDITNGEMKMLMPEDFEGVEYYGHIITGWTEAKENEGTRYRTDGWSER